MRRLSQLYFNFAQQVDRALNARIHDVTRQLISAELEGVTDVIPGYTTLHVEYDPEQVSAAHLTDRVMQGMEAGAGSGTGGKLVSVDTVYDGPDLADLAAASGMSTDEAVRRHSGTDYLAYAVEPIFEGSRDVSFASGRGPLAAHTDPYHVSAKHLEGVSHVGRSVGIEDRRGDVVGPAVGGIGHERCVFLWFDFLNLTKERKENAVDRCCRAGRAVGAHGVLAQCMQEVDG